MGEGALGEMVEGESVRDTFVALIEAHRGIIRKVARAYCWSADDRDDLEQDILAQAWRAYPSYDRGRPFGTWFYRVALNVAISWVRTHAARQRATVPLDPDLHDIETEPLEPVATERVRALTAAIQQLEPLDRALVLLYLDEGRRRSRIPADLRSLPSRASARLGLALQAERRRDGGRQPAAGGGGARRGSALRSRQRAADRVTGWRGRITPTGASGWFGCRLSPQLAQDCVRGAADTRERTTRRANRQIRLPAMPSTAPTVRCRCTAGT